jgi:hypothetical protein
MYTTVKSGRGPSLFVVRALLSNAFIRHGLQEGPTRKVLSLDWQVLSRRRGECCLVNKNSNCACSMVSICGTRASIARRTGDGLSCTFFQTGNLNRAEPILTPCKQFRDQYHAPR